MISAAGVLGGRRRWVATTLLSVVAFAALARADVAPASRVPRSFFGIVPQAVPGRADLEQMSQVAGTVRMPIYWFDVEPVEGQPDFSQLDELVGESAEAGLRLVPYIYGTPAWLEDEPSRAPIRNTHERKAWARFIGELVDRYGPRGDFWEGQPVRRPIRHWQIWNEPNFPLFWAGPISAAGYVSLLRSASRAITTRDPGAVIVLGGLAPVVDGPLPWVYLSQVLRVPGAKSDFDVVGLHPYSGGMEVLSRQIRFARSVMARLHAMKPIEVTEFGVASDGDRVGLTIKTPAAQAGYLGDAFELLVTNRRRWRIAGADWYSWRDGAFDPHCVFCQYSGLLDEDGRAKPAWATYTAISRKWAKR
jgi:hypothetical protein